MNKKIIITILIFITNLSYSAKKEEPRLAIDWIKGVITADSKSSLTIDDNGTVIDNDSGNRTSISASRNRAYESAREKTILEVSNLVCNINIDSSTRIKDLIIKDPYVRQRIAQQIHEFSKFKEKPSGYLSSGCTLEFKLGYLLDAINYSYPENPFPERDDTEISTRYTSLIVDTRGLNIKPMLLPAVLNESGLEIYNRNYFSPRDALRFLAVSYEFTEKDAVKNKKAGKQPYYCNALKSLDGNPVISDEDAKRILSHKENLAYLKKCRVIFIIDR